MRKSEEKRGTAMNTLAKALPSNVTISRAKWSDMTTVAGFIRSSASWYEKFVSPEDMKEHLVGQEWIEKNYFRREFFVGRYDGKPFGTISIQHLNGYAYLGYIYLDVEFVGKGLGHVLMDHARDLAQKRNLKGMILIAHPEAKWATKAYIKYGFECISCDEEEILAWGDGALKSYYEKGFDLYRYTF